MAKQPDKIDKYSEVSLIARGGMGAVYKALHPTLNRPVILKKLTLRGQSSFAERFKREARILMDFRHDDIVTVFDHFKQGSSYYIVMEYVEGSSLEELLREHRYLDSIVCAYIVLHSARALAYAHERGVIHRDIKPANILISREGAIKLADFGIAASADETDLALTSDGMTLGTPSYMAPEQFENSRNVDAKADIYALGIMTYEMSTGKRPYAGGFTPDLIHAKQKGRYTRPTSFVPVIARPLLKIIRGSMRSSRKRRFNSVDPIIRQARKVLETYNQNEIKSLLGALVRGEKDLPAPKQRKRPLRTGLRWLGILCLTGILLWGIYASTLFQPLFLGSTHGRLRIQIELPGLEGYYAGNPVKAELFVDDGKDIPLVSAPVLVPLHFLSRDETRQYTTLPMMLKSGMYRVKVRFAGQIYWKSFYLPPSDAALKEGPFSETLESLQLPEIQSGPVEISFNVYDAVRGKSLNNEALAYVLHNDVAVPIYRIPDIESGRVWRFLVRSTGYIEQVFSLYLDPRETHLTINAALLPRPAFLRIESKVPDADIRINDSGTIDTYMNVPEGSYQIHSTHIGTAVGETMAVPPGRYRISFQRKGEKTVHDVNLMSDETASLIGRLENGSLQIVREPSRR
jgi:serine/threonine-protein kinase